jgi:hypothetical protein
MSIINTQTQISSPLTLFPTNNQNSHKSQTDSSHKKRKTDRFIPNRICKNLYNIF